MKRTLCSEKCLALFDPNRLSIVSADASAYGLGAVLSQKQPDNTYRPVIYISRSMTETEQRYAQIEKEALALTWTCDRLNQYLLGSKFILETDHKPLVPLLSSKNLDELPMHIQRFRLRMMRYTYDIRHVPGKELNTADFLSRAPLSSTEDQELEKETEAYINFVQRYLPVTDRKLKEIRQYQEEDEEIQKLSSDLLCGEGRRKRKVLTDLAMHNGILMRGNRIVIPKKLIRHILEQLHTGHQGIVKCKERARCSVWWPEITSDIEQYIEAYRICCQH